MPTEPYKAHPTVEPAERPPDDYFHLEASPERFAAGAKGIEQFGGEVTKTADLWGQLQVDAQANSALKQGDELLNKLRNLHGQEQIDFANSLPQQIEGLVSQGAQGLSPVQQNRYRNIMAPYQFRLWNGEIATSQSRAAGEVAKQTYEDTANDALSRAGKYWNNDEEFKHAEADIIYAQQQRVKFEGNENVPGAMENAARQGSMLAYKERAEKMFVYDKPGALQFVKDNQEKLGAAATVLEHRFLAGAEKERNENSAAVMGQIAKAPSHEVAVGIANANINNLTKQQYDSVVNPQSPAATPAAPKQSPSDFVHQQIEQETLKPPGQPTQAPGQAAPPKPGAQIDVPLDGRIAMLSLSRMGRGQLVEEAIKQYPPLTTLNVSGRKFTIPAAGTTFEIEGIKHTVPASKAAAPTTQPAATAPAAQPTAPQQNAVPGKSSQNFSPVPNQKTGQALPFGEEQTVNYSPAQTAIARAIDSRTEKDLNVRQLPGNVLETARDVALHSGPAGLRQFMAAQGYPKAGSWCGEFAAAVVRSAGGTPPKNPEVASNWRGWGGPSEPRSGAVAVRRVSLGGNNVPTGQTGSHVTFVESVNPQAGTFTGIGGNQGHGRSTFRLSDYEFRNGMPEREAQK